MGIEKGRFVSRPLALALGCWEISRERTSGWNVGETSSLHYICDAPEIQPFVVPRNPRVGDFLGAGQFDHRDHIRCKWAVVHSHFPSGCDRTSDLTDGIK